MKRISVFIMTIAFITALTLSFLNTARAGYPEDEKLWQAWSESTQVSTQAPKKVPPTGYPEDSRNRDLSWQTDQVKSDITTPKK